VCHDHPTITLLTFTGPSFLGVKDYPKIDGPREALLAHFNVPAFVANRACHEINGYSGCSAIFDEDSQRQHVTSYSMSTPNHPRPSF